MEHPKPKLNWSNKQQNQAAQSINKKIWTERGPTKNGPNFQKIQISHFLKAFLKVGERLQIDASVCRAHTRAKTKRMVTCTASAPTSSLSERGEFAENGF